MKRKLITKSHRKNVLKNIFTHTGPYGAAQRITLRWLPGDVIFCTFPPMMRLWSLLLLGCIPFCLRAQTNERTEWEALLEQHLPRWMERYHVPGVVVITLRQGIIDDVVIRGWADKPASLPLTNQHFFPLGRLTQPLTAYAVLNMEAKGSVRLDLPVNTYLEGWTVLEGPYNPGDVTLRGLLSHSAGIQSWPDLRPIAADTLSVVDKLIGRNGFPPARMQDRPGTGYRYSQAGYLIVQKVIEDVTGMSFSSYMEDSVYAQLDMRSGRVGSILPVDSSWALPHHWNEKVRQVPNRVRAPAARGGYMFPLDYARFWEALMTTDDSTRQQIWDELQRQQVEAISYFLPPGAGYGFAGGIIHKKDSLTLVTGFTEDLQGWANGYCVIPERRAGVLVFTNGVGGEALVNRVVSGWTQRQQNIAPPPRVTIAFWRDWVAIALTGLILLVSGYLAYRLYITRRQRTLGIFTVIRGIQVLGWLALFSLTLRLVLPEILEHLPHLFMMVSISLTIYLLVLLGWLVVPIRSSAGT